MNAITHEWFLKVETNYGGKFVKGPVAICTLLEKKGEKGPNREIPVSETLTNTW